MRVSITLDEALQRASSPLASKIQEGVELIKKAERLANMYSDKGFYLAFSGGKDSQALYHMALLAGVKFYAEYSVTTCDPAELIAFIKKNYPEVAFTKPERSIYSMASTIRKGMLPTRRARWCCASFKEGSGGNMVTLTGVRKEESARRAKRKAVETRDKKFSGGIDEFEDFRKDRFEHRKKTDTNDYLKFRCIKGKDGVMVMPIIEWTSEDVWEFLNDVVGVPHCKLYDEGYDRIGCILCPLKNKSERFFDANAYPHQKHKWVEVILKRFRERPWEVAKWFPEQAEIFESPFRKETVESFGGKYSEREIEAAEAFFDYWMEGVKYEDWVKKAYYINLPTIKLGNCKIKISILNA